MKAQQANIWYFPPFSGLNFNTNPPSFLYDGQLQSGGAASIADLNGNLLFYTNGTIVYNKLHQVMDNGFGLNGFFVQTGKPTVIIVPFVNDTNKFYIFSTNLNSPLGQTDGYWYHVVDISLNNGLGRVTQKNILLDSNTSNEFTVKKCNDGYWLITSNNSFSVLKSYKISCLGIDTNPVVDYLGNGQTMMNLDGDMRCSANNDYLALCYGTDGYIDLYKYSSDIGKTYGKVRIKNLTFPYSMEFSSKGNFLYVSDYFSGVIPQVDQFNITFFDSLSINNSKVKLDSALGIPSALLKVLQRGPDDKIYTAASTDSFFYIINNPDIFGTSCNMSKSNIQCFNSNLPSSGFGSMLPYFVPSIVTNTSAQISYTVAPDCRTVNFTGLTTIKGNNLAFKWKFTATDSLIQNIPSQGDTTLANTTFTFPPGIDSFNVQLFVTSDTVCGLGRTGKLVVVKPPPPIANFGYGNTCNNLTVNFTDSSLLNFNPSLSYQYAYKPIASNTYTNFSVSPNPSFAFPSLDSFMVRLIVTSSLSCVQNDTIEKLIILRAKPIANASYNNVCGSLSANFTNASTITAGSISSVRYFLNNNLISSTANFTYAFSNYGNYTIKQVATSSAGCVSDTFLLNVIIKDKPTVNLVFANDSLCVGSVLNLQSIATANAAIVNNYNWQVNNNPAINNATNTQIFNLTVGNYNIKHWVNANNGCNSDTINQAITVVGKPIATLSATETCGSKTIAINTTANVANDNITQHFIDYGNGVTQITVSAPTSYTYSNFGTYTIKYVSKSSISCTSDTATQTITIKDKPITDFVYNNNGCNNTNFTLQANAAVNNAIITSYNWQVNNGAVLNNANANQVFNVAAGTYTIKHWVSSNQNCVSDTVTKTIIIASYPTANFTVQNTCTNKIIILQNNSVGNNLTYTWNFADGSTSTQANPTKQYSTVGTYNIKLKIENTNGCADSIVRPIIIEPAPTAAFTATDLCLGKNIGLLNNSTGNINTYNWNFGDGSTNTQQTPIKIYNAVGNYNIQLTVTSQYNCTASTTEPITIQQVTINTNTKDTTIAQGQPLQLQATGAATYLWQSNFGIANTIVNPTIFTTNTIGVYPIKVEGTSSNGCKGNTDLIVRVFSNAKNIWIPTIFTPNNDGINDVLQITCTGVQQLKYFNIYNRYGQLIFSQTNCTQQGWNGKFKNVQQPTGAYVYTYQAINFEGKTISGKGTVVLAK